MSTVFRQHIEKIIALTDDEFEFVLSHFEHRHYRKHDVLIREGEKSEYVFFVVTGLLELVHTDGHIGSQQRILSLITSNAKERYDQLLKRYPSLFQRVSKTLIASYLGVSRETLSRLSG